MPARARRCQPRYRGEVLFEPVVEELSFACQGNRLVGDLVLPPWPGPYPCVVYVEGSGPGGRDQGLWPTRLAAAGFASLAYDKPGSGASTGDWTDQSLTDRAWETVGAIEAVQSRGDVLPDAVALLGGSQGGWVAQIVASLTGKVAAIVTVSGPGVGVLAQEEYRLRHQLPAEGFSARDVEAALALLHEQIRRIAAGEDSARVHADQLAWRDAAWYPLLVGTTPASIAFLGRIAAFDPVPAMSALRCPVLAIFGADDVLVPVVDSVRAIDNALTEAGHADHQIVVFPHADHNIRVFKGDGPPRISHGHYVPGERAAGFDELVVTWLQHRLVSR